MRDSIRLDTFVHTVQRFLKNQAIRSILVTWGVILYINCAELFHSNLKIYSIKVKTDSCLFLYLYPDRVILKKNHQN